MLDDFGYISGFPLCPVSTGARRCVSGGCRRFQEDTHSPPRTPPHNAAGQRGRSNGSDRKTRRFHTAWWLDS